MNNGYFRFPTIFKDTIIFVSEDDLWTVPASGGRAARLTSTNGLITSPCFSPDGQWIAFSGQEEGAKEVYVVPSEGGEVQRLTYLGGAADVVGFTPEGEILFSSGARNHIRTPMLMKVSFKTMEVTDLKLGEATSIAIGQMGAVIERNSHRPDPAHWKRYRGGTAGQLWTATTWDGEYRQILIDLKGNLSSPLLIENRIYFLSDHEGWGNIYSCDMNGSNLKSHTNHKDFYARNIKSDGEKIVYHAGADIYLFDSKTNISQKVKISYNSQRTQCQRKFVKPEKYWEGYDISPDGEKTCFGARGQVFAFDNWSGATIKLGEAEHVRYRQGHWLKDSQTIVLITDENKMDQLEIYDYSTNARKKVIKADFGHILKLKPAPTKEKVAVVNNRNELFVVDIETGTSKLVTCNKHGFMFHMGFNWSPDSQWIAFGQTIDKQNQQIHVYNVNEESTKSVTRSYPSVKNPCFDLKGRYLYFISSQKLKPTYSDVTFDLSYIESHVPCVVPLKKQTLSPFYDTFASEEKKSDAKKTDKEKQEEPVHVEIDFNGIGQRMQSFPTEPKLFKEVLGANDNKVYYLSTPATSVDLTKGRTPELKTNLVVKCYDFKLRKEETYLDKVTDYSLTLGGQFQVTQVKNSIQVTKYGEKPDLKAPEKEFNKKTGRIDLSRLKVLVDPKKEWRQMYSEVWRLQKEYYWQKNMAQLDWQKVYDLYEPLLDRISTRSEFSDLAWEMQGELGTSHAYEMGGDTRRPPNYPIGFLGADFVLSGSSYRIAKIFDGEVSDAHEMAPLLQPGLNLKVGDEIVSIDGILVNEKTPPESLLLHKANTDVLLKVRYNSGDEKSFSVRTLNFSQDQNLRYRDWVETNRHYVHRKTNGKVGYVHIPDMSAGGYCEFFRNYLREHDKDGIVVDARYNGGGHVSQIILRYLSQKRVGFDQSRWIGIDAYPVHSPAGPMVALTNRYAGSDGDIFPHAFKLMGLGPVIGTRTWGGVIGIYPRNMLVDGGITTQPEFSFWFKDVGWGVENYGTDPDIVVEKTPQDFRSENDPQLDRGIEEVLALINKEPPLRPSWTEYPDLSQHML